MPIFRREMMQRGFSNIADISAKLFRFWSGDTASVGDSLQSAGAGKPPLFQPGGGSGGVVVQQFFINSGAQQLVANQLIPADNTIPQITEGAEILTLACTGLTIGNILEIDWHVNYASSGGGTSLMIPIFIDAITDAIATGQQNPGIANALKEITSKTQFTITAASHTIRMRLGTVANVTVSINGVAGAARFGGTSTTYIAAKELTP